MGPKWNHRLHMGNVMNLIDLETFVWVAELGSLTAAGKQLKVPKSTVSRRVSRLEDELSVALVHRTARSVVVTERGQQLALRAAPAFRELRHAEHALFEHGDQPRGLLRITAPSDIGASKFINDLLLGFRERWPQVSLDILLTERVVDLIQEGIDVALRPAPAKGTWQGEGLMSRSLGSLTAVVYASPDYLARHGTPKHPQQLLDHDWIGHQAWLRRGPVALTHRESGEVEHVELSSSILTNHIDQVVAMIAGGAGLGIVPSFLVGALVDEGTLQPVLTDWDWPGGRLTAVWPASRHTSPRVRAFVDHAVAYVRRSLEV